jgi:hypothetical protein
MKHARLLGLGLVMALLAPSARSQDDKAPEWKFDKPFSQKWETKVKQTVTVAKGTTGQEGKTATYDYTVATNVTWTPEKPSGAGQDSKEQTLTLKIDSIKISGKAPGGDVSIDSAEGEAKVPVAALLKKLAGAELKVKIDRATMKAEVTGLDAMVEKLPKGDRTALGQFLARDALARQIEAAFPPLPKKKGDKTSAPERELAAGKLGKYKAVTSYTYDDLKDKKVQLKTASEWTFTPGDAVQGIKVEKVDPPQVKLNGTVVFDPEKGRAEKATLEGKELKQTLTLEADKQKLTADVVLDYSLKVETTDK